MNAKISRVGAVVMAAGASRRMGQSKMLMPWGQTTVIGMVIQTLLGSGVVKPVVVTGRAVEEVHAALAGNPILWAHNPSYETTEMLQSLQIGLRQIPQELEAFLVVLGDQPQIEGSVVANLLATYQETESALLIPSFHQRRGHPWLVKKSLWADLLALDEQATLRQFLNSHTDQIKYLNVETDSVLMDLDTPEDYARYQSPVIKGNGKNV